eukprot:scaffold3410_cov158-Amphora_coffeaeformis.AAC.6
MDVQDDQQIKSLIRQNWHPYCALFVAASEGRTVEDNLELARSNYPNYRAGRSCASLSLSRNTIDF